MRTILDEGTKYVFHLCCIPALQTVVVDHEFGTAVISATATGFQQPHLRAARAQIPVTALGGVLHNPVVRAQCSLDGFISFTHSSVQMRQLCFMQHCFYTGSWLSFCTRCCCPCQIHSSPREFFNQLGEGITEKCFSWFFNELVNLCCLPFTKAAMCFMQLSLGKANGLLLLQSWVGKFCMSKAKAV